MHLFIFWGFLWSTSALITLRSQLNTPGQETLMFMILIVPTAFRTHCVRVSIQIRANIIIFFINSVYNIKPLIMFRRVSVSLDHHQWVTNVKILWRLAHCHVVKHFREHSVNNWNTKHNKLKYKCKELIVYFILFYFIGFSISIVNSEFTKMFNNITVYTGARVF
jgi:hypothetical protein